MKEGIVSIVAKMKTETGTDVDVEMEMVGEPHYSVD